MQTTTVFTKHFTADGENAKGRWVRNDFRTEDGQKFSTFNAGIASKVLTIGLDVPINVEYETPNSQYPNSHDLKGVAPASVADPTYWKGTYEAQQQANGEGFTPPDDPKFWPSQPPVTTYQIKPVDRNAGLARAIEFCGVTGEDLKEAYLDGSLFEMADVFAAYGALNQKPSFTTETPTV